MAIGLKQVLLIIAVVLFCLYGLEVDPAALDDINLLGIGLAFFAAAFLVP